LVQDEQWQNFRILGTAYCVAFSVDDDDQLHVCQNLKVSYNLKYRVPIPLV